MVDIYLTYKHINFSKDKDLWMPVSENEKDIHMNLLRINLYFLKKIFNKIYLITDSYGEKIFKDLSFLKIYPILDNIDEKRLIRTPTICKIYSYKFAAEKERPFLHVDNDFFILSYPHEDFLNAEAVAESKELDYSPALADFRKPNLFKNKYHYQNISPYYNCGIFGGNNIDFLKEYACSALNFVLDKDNSFFWLHYGKNTPLEMLNKSIVAEQIYYASCINKFNINIDFFSNKKYKHKYHHFGGFNKYDKFKDINSNTDPEQFCKNFLL